MKKGTITKDNKYLNYEIVIKKNKNSYFRVKDGTVVVTTNIHTNKHQIYQVIFDNFDSFYEKVEHYRQRLNKKTLSLFGKELFVNIFSAKTHFYEIENDQINIYIPNPDKLDEFVNFIYEEELRNKITNFEPILIRRLKLIGLEVVPYKIKNVKSYFGKCLVNRNLIYYNLKLATLDEKFLEYVIFHEYAHFIVPNHSKKFYQVLEILMPEHKKIQKELSKVIL